MHNIPPCSPHYATQLQNHPHTWIFYRHVLCVSRSTSLLRSSVTWSENCYEWVWHSIRNYSKGKKYQIDVSVNCEFYDKIPFWIGQGHKLKRAFSRRKDRKRQQSCMQRSRDRKPVFNFSLKIWKNVWPQQRPTLALKGTISHKYLSHPKLLQWKINKAKKSCYQVPIPDQVIKKSRFKFIGSVNYTECTYLQAGSIFSI